MFTIDIGLDRVFVREKSIEEKMQLSVLEFTVNNHTITDCVSSDIFVYKLCKLLLYTR